MRTNEAFVRAIKRTSSTGHISPKLIKELAEWFWENDREFILEEFGDTFDNKWVREATEDMVRSLLKGDPQFLIRQITGEESWF